MSDPIFVKIRNDQGEIYPSYDIYWQLIDLSGFPTCELDDVDPASTNTYIFSPANGNVKACCERPHTARYIHWNIEVPVEGYKNPDYFDETWVSCRYFYSIIEEPKKFIVMGGHLGLVREPDPEKAWDFCHMSYLYGKRAQQVAELEAQGCTMAPVGWGDVRDKAIAKSRFGLILHQHNVPALSPQRMTLFSCRKLPMVVERCDAFPYEVSYLPAYYPNNHTEMVERNFDYFVNQNPFRKCVEEAL